MRFDAKQELARIRAGKKTDLGGDDTATTATTATNSPSILPFVANVAVVAAPTESESEKAEALEMAMDQAQERAAIMEFDAGLTRPKAEHRAAMAAALAWGVPIGDILAGLGQ